MTSPYYEDSTVRLFAGDCLDVLTTLPDNSVDAVVTDPPYGLEFMGKDWDAPWKMTGQARHGATTRTRNPDGTTRNDAFRPGTNARPTAGYNGHDSRAFQAWCQTWAEQCLRVLKPGGHLLAFGGTRTSHRLATAIEDAGFEIRDSIAWLYGSGFPKSLDVSKAIDKASGAEREDVGPNLAHHGGGTDHVYAQDDWTRENFAQKTRLTAPATDAARQWQGWGTALKPAHEPIVVARKPLAGSTVAANVLAYGTGALNIDSCRIGYASDADRDQTRVPNKTFDGSNNNRHGAIRGDERFEPAAGRWPANVVLDDDQAAALDRQSGDRPVSGSAKNGTRSDATPNSIFGGARPQGALHDDEGGASRFFYTAKAATDERTRVDGISHPTVKPLSLMRWLVRLVTPPGGTILDPFAGSGTTIEAAILEGFHCIAIEREPDYLPLCLARIHRRRDPVAAIKLSTPDDLGLFGVEDYIVEPTTPIDTRAGEASAEKRYATDGGTNFAMKPGRRRP